MEWLRRVHRENNDCVSGYFARARAPAAAAASVAPLELECDKLTPEVCGRTGEMVSRGTARRVRVDCLLYDDDGMRRLTSVVPLSKIEMDFTELFRVPDSE
jgi:hypothetical protein